MAQASQAGRAMAQSPSGRATAVSHRPAVPWLSKSPAGRAMAQSPSGHAMAQSPSGRAMAQLPSGRAMAQSPSGRAIAVSQSPSARAMAQSPSGHAMAQSPSGRAIAVSQSPSGRAMAQSVTSWPCHGSVSHQLAVPWLSQSPSGRAMAQSVTSWPCHGASSALCQCTLRLPQTSAVPNSSASPPTAHTHLMFIFVLFLSYEQLGGAWRPALGKHSLEIASYSRPCTDDFLREISHKNSFRNQTSVDTQITPPLLSRLQSVPDPNYAR